MKVRGDFNEDYWCPADPGNESAEKPQAAPLIAGALWVALLKVSNGDGIAPAEQDWLCAESLVEMKEGVSVLTAHGRAVLGL